MNDHVSQTQALMPDVPITMTEEAWGVLYTAGGEHINPSGRSPARCAMHLRVGAEATRLATEGTPEQIRAWLLRGATDPEDPRLQTPCVAGIRLLSIHLEHARLDLGALTYIYDPQPATLPCWVQERSRDAERAGWLSGTLAAVYCDLRLAESPSALATVEVVMARLSHG